MFMNKSVNSESDTEYVDCDFENKVDESLKKIVEEKLPTEPLQGRSIIRARTLSRIQDISDINVPEDLIEVKNQDIVLPTYGNGSKASGMQNFGNGDIPGNRNTVLAETHYQLVIAFRCATNYKEGVCSLKSAATIIKLRIQHI
ncbi:hypothetical protein DAPPUDRAFT_337082, partial [Daphnia pulex]